MKVPKEAKCQVSLTVPVRVRKQFEVKANLTSPEPVMMISSKETLIEMFGIFQKTSSQFIYLFKSKLNFSEP